MTNYEKLKSIIDEIDELIRKKVTSSDPAFKAWQIKAERFLIKVYGKDSLEHTKFKDTHFSLMIFLANTTHSEFVEACRDGLKTTKAIFSTYLEELNEGNDESTVVETQSRVATFGKIFVVHGHDGELKHSVARIIEKQGIEAVILSEQANQGQTIIEKFEKYSDVSGAICLFTADDVGYAKASEDEKRFRARQNVVLETGYFMGKLGRNHVVLLADKGVEMPSDLSGVVYTDTTSWQFDLLRELNAMGYKVDLNKLL